MVHNTRHISFCMSYGTHMLIALILDHVFWTVCTAFTDILEDMNHMTSEGIATPTAWSWCGRKMVRVAYQLGI